MVTSCPAACTLTKRSVAILGRMAAIMKPSVPTAKVPTASQYSGVKWNCGTDPCEVTAVGPAAGCTLHASELRQPSRIPKGFRPKTQGCRNQSLLDWNCV